jgi:hypothetical protein
MGMGQQLAWDTPAAYARLELRVAAMAESASRANDRRSATLTKAEVVDMPPATHPRLNPSDREDMAARAALRFTDVTAVVASVA